MTRGRWLNELKINQLHRIKNISIKSYKKKYACKRENENSEKIK